MAVRTRRIFGPIEITGVLTTIAQPEPGRTALIKTIRIVNPSSVTKSVLLNLDGSGSSTLVLRKSVLSLDTFIDVSEFVLQFEAELLAQETPSSGAHCVISAYGSYLLGDPE